MNTKNNQRTRLTKMLLKNAYIQLMEEKKGGRITVKDICSIAEVNRSTFYLHYQEPNDILIDLENEIIDQTSEFLKKIGASPFSSSKEYIAALLHYIREHDRLFRTFLANNPDIHFRQKLSNLALEITGNAFDVPVSSELKPYVYQFVINGGFELLICWIRSDYELPESVMINLVYNLGKGSFKEVIMMMNDG